MLALLSPFFLLLRLLGRNGREAHRTVARIGARSAGVALALLAGFSANVASASDACTLDHTDVSSLRVVAGSAEATVLDTGATLVWQRMVAEACANGEGGAQQLTVEDHTANPAGPGPLIGNATINYADGSVVRVDNGGTGGDFRIRFTPGTGTGPRTIFPASATSYTGTLLSSASPAVIRIYSPDADANSDIITVIIQVDAPNAPTAAIALPDPSTIYAGGTSAVTVTLSNPNPTAALSGVANTINLPSGVTLANTTFGGTCTGTHGGSGSQVTLLGGSLAVGGSCTMTFNVTSSTVANHTIPSGTPSASGANAGTAGGTETLTVQTPPSPPTITADWDAANVAVNATGRTLTVRLTNPNAISLTGVGFNAGTLPSGFNVTNLTGTCLGASYNGGTRQLAMSGHTLTAGANCTATLDFTVTTRGAYTFSTGTAFATGPVSVTGLTATTGTLTVWSPPTVSVTAATPINIGDPSTVTLTYANANTGNLTGVGSTAAVSLPGGVVIATPSGISNACGSSVTASAGAGTFAVAGLTVPGGGNCVVSFNVTSSTPATYAIPTGTPTSTQGGAGVAGSTASLVVNNVPPVLTGFTHGTTIAYNGSGTIPAGTSTSPTNSPTSWVVSKTSGGSFDLTAQSENSSSSNVTINGGTGSVTYNAPTGFRGTDTFYVRAANGGGNSNVVAVNVNVGDPTLSISLSGSGVRGTALSGVAVVTTGGQASYGCGAPSTPLPSGVTLNANCTITGTASVSGDTSFRVSVTDSSTGTGPVTQQSPLLTLTIVPPAPTVTSVSPDRGSALGGTPVVINGTNFDPGQVTTVEFGGASIPFTVDASGTFITVTTEAHAAGSADVRVTTTGGTSANTVDDNFTFVTPPSAPVVSTPASGSRTNDATPTYSGTASNGLTITVYVDASSVGTTTSAGGTWSLTPVGDLSDGLHTVRATATELGVTSDDSNTNSFTVDTSAPAAPVVTAPVTGTSTNDSTPTFTGTAEANSTVRVFIGGSFSGLANLTGTNWEYTPTALGNATYSFWATATDVAGNLGPQSTTGSLTIDTVAPPVPVVQVPADGAVTSTTPTISGTAEVGAIVTIVIDGVDEGTDTADGAGTWSFAAGPLSTGARTVAARARDAANNSSVNSTAVNFTVAATPTVTSLSPASGPLGGTTIVALTGTGFSGVTAVDFGGNPASSFTVNSPTGITATAPSGSAGAVNVTVTTPGGTSATEAANVYTYVAAPAVGSISPDSGTTAGGTSITLTGTGFTGATAVSFGASPASAFVVDDDTTITATSPNGSGTANIRVTTVGGTSAIDAGNLFTWTPPAPVVSAPTAGSTTADNTPTYSGTAQAGATVTVIVDSASIGTTTATGGNWTLTQPTALGDGSHDVEATATVGGITGAASVTVNFSVDATAPDAPVVVTPANGSTTSDTTPTITGTADANVTVSVYVDGGLSGTTTASAGGAWSFTAASLAETAHTVRATATDAVGNTSGDSNTNTFTVDSLAPPAPMVVAPADGTTITDATPTISGTAEANASVTVSIDGMPAGTTTASAGGAWSFTSGALADGAHTAKATATDAGGNTSVDSNTNSFTIDASAPNAPVITAPADGSTGADTTPTITGTSEANATIAISIDGAAAGTTTASAGGAWSFTSAALGEGSHTVLATATDGAGNASSPSATITFSIDTSPPGAPAVLVPAAGSVTADTTPTISGTAEANATVTVVIDGGVAGTAPASAGGAWSFTSAVLAQGAHTVRAIASDSTGNVSPSSATVNFTVDTSAPAAPVITAPADGATIATTTPVISGTAEANATVSISIDGSVAGTATAAGGAWTFTSAALTQGAHTATATSTDAAGNISATSAGVTFTVDTAAPAAPAISTPVDGSTFSDNTPTIAGTADAGTTVTISIDAAIVGTVTADGGGAWTFTTAALAEGSHVASATATDGVGNVSPATSVDFTIDSAAPALPVITSPTDNARVASATPPISGTTEPGATVTVTIDGAAAGTAVADGSGLWSFTPASALAQGAHSVSVTATDASGNVSSSSTAIDFTVDTNAPGAPVIVAPLADAVLSDTTPVISGTAEAGATVTVTIDGGVAGTAVADGAGSWTFTPATLAEGEHSVVANATDAVGNASASSVAVSFTIDSSVPAAPVIAAPADDALVATTTPEISGTAEAAATVTILIDGAVAGSVTASGTGAWTFTPSAALAQGAHSIGATATDAGGNTSAQSVAIDITVDTLAPAAPVITAPAEGAVLPSNTPDVTGTAEAGATVRVFLDDTEVGTATASGAGAWSFTTAALAPGSHTVRATAEDSGGNVSAASTTINFSVTPPPVVTPPASVEVPYDTATAIDLTASITGEVTSIAVVTAPEHGTTTVSGLVVTFTPTAGYYGADSFVVTATGPGGTSAPATITLEVQTPAAPVAADLADVEVPYASEGTAIDLTDSITGVRTAIAIATPPEHGEAKIEGEVVTYTPAEGYYGADSFTYTATGPGGTSPAATVTLAVALPPVPVVADLAGVEVPYDSEGTLIDLAESVTGVYATVEIATEPTNGTATIEGTVVTYVPNTGYYGPDSFTYTATGPGGVSAPATVGIVIATPPPPVAAPTSVTVAGSVSQDSEVGINLTELVGGIYDSIQISGQPANGTVTLNGTSGTLRKRQATEQTSAVAEDPIIAVYQPNAGFAGTDSFQFVAIGPGGTSPPATVTVTVVGSVPTVQPKEVAAGDGETVSVELTEGATQGPFTGAEVLDVAPVEGATTRIVEGGTAEARTYRLDITAAARFSGTVVIGYRLSNQYGASARSTVTVTVTARPDPSADPVVRGLSDAQAETTRRFARAQVDNFMQRNEHLHGSGGSADPQFGMRLSSRDGTVQGGRMPPAWDAATLEITSRMREGSVEDGAYAEWQTRRSLDGFRRLRNEALLTGGTGIGGRAGRGDRGGPGGAFGGDGAAYGAMTGGGTMVGDPAYAAGEEEDPDGPRRVGQIGIWSAGGIEIGTLDRTTDRAKITATTGGLSAGMDVKLAEGLTAGLGGGYGNDVSHIDGDAGVLRATNSVVAGYASYTPVGEAFVDGMLGYGTLDFSTRRRVAAVNAVALGNRDGSMMFGALAAGIDRQSETLRWSAYGRVEFVEADLDAYVESGAGRYDLRFDPRSLSSLTGALGGLAEFRQKTAFGWIVPRARVEWRHEFAQTDPQWLDYADIPGASIYHIDTEGWKREQFDVSFGTRAEVGTWAFDVGINLSAGAGQRSGTLELGVSTEF